MVDVQTVLERLEALKGYLAEPDHCAQVKASERKGYFLLRLQSA